MLSYKFETTLGWIFFMKKQKSITKHPKNLHLKVLQNLSWKVNSTKLHNCWIRYTIFKKYDLLLPTCFQVKHERLNCKGQKKKCLQNQHKRKHCWALDATVKIADARSLRSEGQMFFLVKSWIWILLSGRQRRSSQIHRAR